MGQTGTNMGNIKIKGLKGNTKTVQHTSMRGTPMSTGTRTRNTVTSTGMEFRERNITTEKIINMLMREKVPSAEVKIIEEKKGCMLILGILLI